METVGGQASTKLRHEDLMEALSDLESDAEMVATGKRGEDADFANLDLGSNLERVVRASRKPLLVAARAYAPFNRFLIAYDGGRSANRAVDYVKTTTLLSGLECDILPVDSVNEAPQTLAPCASFAFTATYTPTQADIDAGTVTNTATGAESARMMPDPS